MASSLARALLRSMKPGALLLADLGYFGFQWFDELTEKGYSWISRVKEGTTVAVLHTYYEAGETFDRPRLPWGSGYVGQICEASASNFAKGDSFDNTSPMSAIQPSCHCERSLGSMRGDGISSWHS